MITQTIVAQCTPSGNGAIALLRVSGPEAFCIVNKCAKLSSKKDLIDVDSHTIHHGWVIDQDKNLIDEVLFFAMRTPRTFTGENVIEITCHNNPFIIENIIKQIIACGARPAQPGEFSRQAVENNKLDLIQAEAINELIQANSQQLLKQSLEQLHGTLSQWIQILEKNTIQLIALCEASFEFLEEEMDFSEQMKSLVTALLKHIAEVKKNFDQQQQLRQGVRIALIGNVNVGKSSLFNALIGKKRAIVTNIAGTTRDIIEAGLYENNTYLTLVDTAGLRTTNDIIEQEGIERSYTETKIADIVLLVIDANKQLSEQEKSIYHKILTQYPHKCIPVINKIDLNSKDIPWFKNAIKVSAHEGNGIKELKALLSEHIEKLFSSGSSIFLLNKRHFALLNEFEKNIVIIQEMITKKPDYELIAHHLKEALATLTELTGKSVSERALDAVFKEFCIGK